MGDVSVLALKERHFLAQEKVGKSIKTVPTLNGASSSTHEGLTRRIPGTTDLRLKTGKLVDPISQSASDAPRLRRLDCAWHR